MDVRLIEFKERVKEVIEELYESTDLSFDILGKIEDILQEFNKEVPQNYPNHRELLLFVENAKGIENITKRNQLRLPILENLEKSFSNLSMEEKKENIIF